MHCAFDMPYCLLQADWNVPTADQLKRAFKPLKTLTEADAIKLAREACGILMKNLSLEDARVLQRALQGEGVATDLLDSAQLPKLPEAKFVRRLEIQPQALAVFDPLSRPVPVSWQHVALISAGLARHFNLTKAQVVEPSTVYDEEHWRKQAFVVRTRHNVETDGRLVLDIFLSGGAMRFQIEAEGFLFKYCFDREDLNLPQKLGLLIQMLTERAPHAVMNRGAAALRDGQPENAAYASKAALFDESIWLLWRMAKQG
jgi:hypothetical protein